MLLPLVTAVLLLPEFDITAGGLTLHHILTLSITLLRDLPLKATHPFIGAKCVKMKIAALPGPPFRYSISEECVFSYFYVNIHEKNFSALTQAIHFGTFI